MALTILFYLGLLVFSQAELLRSALRSCNSCDSPVIERNSKKDDTLLGTFYKVVIQNKHHFYACTGAILNETHVITTVTCIFPWETRYKPEDLSIADSITKPTFTHNVTQIILHENFTYYPFLTNDIALLEVTPSFTPSDTIKFAKLPQADDVKDSELALLLGWFTPYKREEVCFTSFGISSYRIFNQNDCMRKYKYAFLGFKVLDTHLCAYSIDRDILHLDSVVYIYHAGELLTVNGTLVGLMSGYHNGNSDLPVLFTRVVSYLTWIK